jgi:hypothetical protein
LLDRVRLENRPADKLGAKVELAPARMLKGGIRERAVREAVFLGMRIAHYAILRTLIF